jgi:cytidylate kinase
MEAAYNQKINAVIDKAKEEYYALPASERTKAKKYDIIMSKVHEITELEIACDREVDSLVEELEGIFKDAGKSTALCGQILDYYQNKKADLRAYFFAYITERKQ